MPNLVRVRFVKPFGAFPEGHEEDFLPEAVARYGDALELVNPPQPVATQGGVEYDSSIVAKMEQTITDLRAERDTLEGLLTEERRKVAALETRRGELEAIVASYTAAAQADGKPLPVAPVSEPAPQPVAEPAVPAPVEAEPAPAAAAVGDDAAPALPPAQPAVAAAPAAAWRATPTAALQIPAGLKGTLMTAGLKTAGEVSDAIADGRVQLLPGIGEAKVEQIRQHLAALAG